MALLNRGTRHCSWASRFTKAARNKPCSWSPCRSAQPFVRSRFTATSPSTPQKPYYVTTPIFYVNAEPHIGHLYSLVLADILKRWQILIGNTDAKLLTGTDEHGMKVQQAATEQKVTPRELCDHNYRTFQSLATEANVSLDHFIRTSDSVHKETVRHFWAMLDKAGYIYSSTHEGWYCVSEETFYPKSGVHAALDPATGRKIMTTMETGKSVEWTSETNYHFRLSAFKDRLLDFYRENPSFIRPQQYMDNVVEEVSNGLQDLSISRPASRLSWGIPVPEDESQTIYVWLDALINYLTYAGYPCTPGQEGSFIWPANVHVIGKDIVRFHAIYWPAFLMALDLPPPRQILTHAHWTLNHQKMSKSTGNAVSPSFAMERFGVDTIRYYLAYHGGLKNDSDYENAYIVRCYKKNLQWGLGNLTSRLVRGRKWNVRDSVINAGRGDFAGPSRLDSEQEQLLRSTARQTQGQMDRLSPREALHELWKVVDETNKYFQTCAPWTVMSRQIPPETEGNDGVTRTIYNIAESLRIVGILLQPFMPEKAATMLDMLGVARDKRTYEFASYGLDFGYGISNFGPQKGTEGTLFPPLACEE